MIYPAFRSRVNHTGWKNIVAYGSFR